MLFVWTGIEIVYRHSSQQPDMVFSWHFIHKRKWWKWEDIILMSSAFGYQYCITAGPCVSHNTRVRNIIFLQSGGLLACSTIFYTNITYCNANKMFRYSLQTTEIFHVYTSRNVTATFISHANIILVFLFFFLSSFELFISCSILTELYLHI